MRRRALLVVAGGAVAGSVAGCLGGLAGGTDPVDGRHQWGYDPGSSDYAAGLAGPAEAPSHRHLYADMGGLPLTDEGVLYSPTAAIGFDGTRHWDTELPVDGGRLRPALHEDTVLCVGREPRLCWALDREDGTERWRTELAAHATETDSGAEVSAVPNAWLTVQDDRAYFSTAIGIGCVDLRDREEAWHTTLYEATPAQGQPAFRPPAATDDHVVTVNQFAFDDTPPVVYALEQSSGDVAWTADIEGNARGAGPPVVADDQVYVVSPVTDPPGEEGDHQWVQVTAIEADDGDIAWRTVVPGVSHYHVAVGDGRLYVGHGGADATDPGMVSAVDTADGDVVWTTEVETTLLFVTLAAERLYVLDAHHLRALDRTDGEPVWAIDLMETLAGVTFPTDLELVECPPVIDDGRVFLRYKHGLAGLW